MTIRWCSTTVLLLLLLLLLPLPLWRLSRAKKNTNQYKKKHQIEPLFKTITVQNYRPEEKTGSFFVD